MIWLGLLHAESLAGEIMDCKPVEHRASISLMKIFICIVSLLTAVMAGNVRAQIYADFTVSHTSLPGGQGVFRARLDYDKAPRTCANFIGLATGQRPWLDTSIGKVVTGKNYYDGLTFHRLDHDFIIQGGDPKGNGSGGPGYVFQDEFEPTLRHAQKYVLSMANSGICTNGSQFFIMLVDNHAAASSLDDKHSVFAEVITGTSTIDAFTDSVNFPTTNETPNTPITITSVDIVGPSLAGFDVNAASLLLPTVNGVDTKIAYDPDTDVYQMTWDRKPQAEYFSALSTNLSTWVFVGSPYVLSLESVADWDYSITGVNEAKFFSRVTEVDYTLLPNAPSDMASNGKELEVFFGVGDSVTLTFDGAGGGTWVASDSSSGTLSNVTWGDATPTSGVFLSSVSQAKFISRGNLEVTFDTAAGPEKWVSLDVTLSYHTATSGWTSGGVVYEIPGPGGMGTAQASKSAKSAFSYTP